jgi:hypothetical protein
MIFLPKKETSILESVLMDQNLNQQQISQIIQEFNYRLQFGNIVKNSIFDFLMNELKGVSNVADYTGRNTFVDDTMISSISKETKGFIDCFIYSRYHKNYNELESDLIRLNFIIDCSIDVTCSHCSGRESVNGVKIILHYDPDKFHSYINELNRFRI